MKTPRHIAKIIVAISISAAAMPPAASAAPLCTFNSVTGNAVVYAPSGTTTLRRSGNLLAANGYLCGGATVSNTRTIYLSGDPTSNHYVIDLGGGPFAPGAGADTDTPEIEFIAASRGGSDFLTMLGSGQADVLTVGTRGVSLNGDSDLDVSFLGLGVFQKITLRGASGNDALSGAGGYGTGLEATGSVALGVDLHGGGGDDVLIPGLTTGDQVVGDDGSDTVDYSPRGNVSGGVTLKLDGRSNDGGWQENDNVDVENIIGTQSGDVLAGNWQRNVFTPMDGNDVITGGGGNDTFLASMTADGADTFIGALGDGDCADYRARRTNAYVTADNVANDGAPGEGDNIRSDVEILWGATANPAESYPFGASMS